MGDDSLEPETASLLSNSRREIKWLLGFWLLLAIWVVGYCRYAGYLADDPSNDDSVRSTTLGFPSWVLWGVVVPWVLATALTSYFALRVMTDDNLISDDEVESNRDG